MQIRTILSHARAREFLKYDQPSGALTWRIKKGRSNPGDDAGTLRKDGNIVVTFDGRSYLANRLAWLLVTGDWPEGRLTFHDRNPSNLKWNNIITERETLVQTKSAAYQRGYRRRARAFAKGDPIAMQKALAYEDPVKYVPRKRRQHL